MPLNPPPVIQGDLLLIRQQIIRSDMSRAAEVEFALRTSDSTLATYQDAIDDFQVNFNATFGVLIDNDCTLVVPSGKGGDGSNVPLLVFGAGAAGVGGQSSATVPPNVAALFKKRTAFGGRKNRGRTYLPFALESGQVSENGTLSGGEQTAFQSAATTFLAQLVTDGTPMVIENRTFNTPLPPHFVTNISGSPVSVVSYTIEPKAATQRRRLAR